MSQSVSWSQKSSQWYRPTISPEHGVYVMLLVSFLIGVAAAQEWTGATTAALLCGLCSFQAEHPLVWQIRQRKSLKPRLLFWASLYGLVAVGLALWLWWQTVDRWSLLWIYAAVIGALIVDVVSVWHGQQKSRVNELITFSAICLLAPLTYVVTVGTISKAVIALWVMNSLFFCSAIFTVKLRKTKTASIIPGVIFHVTGSGIVLALWGMGWLSPMTVGAFVIVIVKFLGILWQKEWYCGAPIKQVALLETSSSLAFLAVVAFSLLGPQWASLFGV